MSFSSPYQAAVVIPTFNRKDHLRQAIQSALAQTVPVELVVTDDGSTDGTAEMMRDEFPQVIFEQHKGPNGPCVMRNRGSTRATAPILFPIDDDAVCVSSRTVEQTLAEFDHPRIGAVGIPYINVRIDQTVNQRAAAGPGIKLAHAYVGAAHALRRDLFLSLGGYRSQLFYMGEEGDYCLRLLEKGYVVRLGQADPMHHFESPKRNTARANYHQRRNDVLFAVHNVPLPLALIHIAATTANGIRHSVKSDQPGVMMRGLGSGWISAAAEWKNRKPVRLETYKLFRRLKLNGPLTLESIEAELPPLEPAQMSR